MSSRMNFLHVLDPSELGFELLRTMGAFHDDRFFLMPNFCLVKAWAFAALALNPIRG